MADKNPRTWKQVGSLVVSTPSDIYVSSGQAALILGVSTATVIRWIAQGRLVARRPGRRNQVLLASVHALLASSESDAKDGGE